MIGSFLLCSELRFKARRGFSFIPCKLRPDRGAGQEDFNTDFGDGGFGYRADLCCLYGVWDGAGGTGVGKAVVADR